MRADRVTPAVCIQAEHVLAEMAHKYIPVALAVVLFVAANFQHSPANMGYFSLLTMETGRSEWDQAIIRKLIPASIGNLIGGTLLVALTFWYAFKGMSGEESEASERESGQ